MTRTETDRIVYALVQEWLGENEAEEGEEVSKVVERLMEDMGYNPMSSIERWLLAACKLGYEFGKSGGKDPFS